MTVFIAIAALLIVGALLMVVPPLFGVGVRRIAQEDAGTVQAKTALGVLREQLADLDAEHAAGRVSAADYQRTREELERRALDEGEATSITLAAQPARAWGIAVAVLVPALAAAVYFATGTPDGLDPVKVAGNDGHQVTQAQVEEMVATLAERLKAEPENPEGWFMLARSYNAMGRFKDAAAAYGELAKRVPDEAQVYADWADALAAANGRALVGEPAKLIDKALSLDPDNIKALALSGSAAFQAGDYAIAVTRWERIVALLPADNELAASIRGGIAEARTRGNLPPMAAAAPAAAATGSGLSLAGAVTLSPALAAKAAPDDVVFIYVRPVEGGMPFAILRRTVADLPLQFDFTGVPSMAGDRPIPAEVAIGARISKSGNAGARPGDLEGAPLTVKPDAKRIDIVVDSERSS